MKKVVKKCELCGSSVAKAHCESDRARLCWDCDDKVHGANFLVAKHTRALLCHICQSPTPWKASGPSLPQASLSLCPTCSCSLLPHAQKNPPVELTHDLDGIDDDNNDDDCNDDDEDEEDEDDDEDDDDNGENQVVPWASAACWTKAEDDDNLGKVLSFFPSDHAQRRRY